MSDDKGRIHPSRQVIMRLPDTDPNKDPWTGAVIEEEGRNLPDDAPLDENISLMPPLGKTSAELGAEFSPPIRPEDLVDEEPADEFTRETVQFSVRDLMLLMTIAAVALASIRWLPPAPLAVFAGAVTVVFLWITHEQRMRGLWVRVITLALVTIYLIATVAAIVNSWGSA